MPNLIKMKMKLGKKSYPILIGENALNELPRYLKNKKINHAVMISDSKLTIKTKVLIKSLTANKIKVTSIPVQAGESLKDIHEVYPIYGKLIKDGANRDSVLIAIGGGSVGDVAGFIASTYLRGIAWISVPTTLLAQVDSGTGGKTGMNHSDGKNLIGAFHQPSLVICDTSFLKTLSNREMISGFGEMIKYAIAFDLKFYHYLEKNLDSLLKGNLEILQHAIKRSLKWKCKMVTKDEFDRTGVREKLNFGHTFGHALESATHYKVYQHGEAVILGIRFALSLSYHRGKLSLESWTTIKTFLKKLQTPKLPSSVKPDTLFGYMKKDKKTDGKNTRFVLLERIGKTISDSKISQHDLKEALKKW